MNRIAVAALMIGLFVVGLGDRYSSAQKNAIDRSEITNFRIDTDIYTDLSEPPIKRSMTLFSGGVYYDFDVDLNQITMTDTIQRQIVLFNRDRQIRCQIACDRLLDYMAKADGQLSPKQRLLLQDADLTLNDQENQVLEIGNDRISYRCEYRVLENANIARQYFDFANWSARLNAIYSAKTPPFIRMQLNDQLLQQKAIPNLITRSAVEGNKERIISAKLILSERLSSDDQASITRVGTMLVQFKEVSITEFMRIQTSAVQHPKTAKTQPANHTNK